MTTATTTTTPADTAAAPLSSLAPDRAAAALAGAGLSLRIGPYAVRLKTPLPEMADMVTRLYAAHPLADPDGFHDIDVALMPRGGLRRWMAPQVVFRRDGMPLFQPQPRDHAPAALEWGLNWCFALSIHDHLVIHAAVAAREDGRAVVMPAPPGSGKSTLCAALVAAGWRLLSDELCLVVPEDGRLIPAPRPIALKNTSIALIGGRVPGAAFGPQVRETTKGTIAHMAPPAASVARAAEPARAAWIVFPRWQAGAETRLEPIGRGHAFLEMAGCAFNYNILGALGFDTLGRVLDGAGAYTFTYSDLDDAVAAFSAL